MNGTGDTTPIASLKVAVFVAVVGGPQRHQSAVTTEVGDVWNVMVRVVLLQYCCGDTYAAAVALVSTLALTSAVALPDSTITKLPMTNAATTAKTTRRMTVSLFDCVRR
ncbi:hypothetical protein ASE12_18015 [Aeromicrobium sp. Root236]|nr:hypothetical protein ASE12_18015 [Aeromicrobium sp. Root236]